MVTFLKFYYTDLMSQASHGHGCIMRFSTSPLVSFGAGLFMGRGEAVLGLGGYLTTWLVSTHWMPVAFPLVVRTKFVSVHYHMSPGGTQLFFLCLAYPTKHNAFKVHLFCWNCHNFLLSYGWVASHCVCVCVCVCVKNIFFIHLSVVRHVGYFCILVIVNNIVINMGVEISFQ